jgi:hypothetical protein
MHDPLVTVFAEHPDSGYRGRTLRNAGADVTIAFAADFTTAGEKLTRRSVLEQGRVYCPVAYRGHLATDNAIQAAVDALNRVGKPQVTVNIAGNGVYTLKGLGDQGAVDAYAEDFLRRVMASPGLTTSIASVRSGGQTGFDEAGVKAAHRLGLPTYVLAPKGWKFRTANGQDISNEQAFKRRFENFPTNEQQITVMTNISPLDQFVSTRRYAQDLRVALGPDHANTDLVDGPGYLYEHGLCIEHVKPVAAHLNEFYVLTIANIIKRSETLSVLEADLYDWAASEGYIFKGEPYSTFAEQTQGSSSASDVSYDTVLQRYRELLNANAGKALVISDSKVPYGHRTLAVADPDSHRVFWGTEIRGPEVIDVREVYAFDSRAFYDGHWDRETVEQTAATIETPTFVDLPPGFDLALSEALARYAPLDHSAQQDASHDGPDH